MTNINIQKEEYIAKIIHDLKTPIGAQIVALESFLSTVKNKISQEEKDLILLTLNSCNYMQKMIEIFNFVYRLNFEPIKLNYEKFDVANVVDDVLAESQILIKYYELNISYKFDKNIILNADKLQIKHVIENLILNSINYAYKNSLVEISSSILNNNFNFIIRNKSPYIPPSELKEIFQKNKIISTLYNKSATSLALYLSKEIVVAHGGLMIAQSYPDNTNIFGFKIPMN